MISFTLTVLGVPQPQGSARAFLPKGTHRPIITSDNPRLKGWRDLVAGEGSRALQAQGFPAGAVIPGALHLTVQFFLPRPKALGSRTLAHVTRPDLDKLTRAIGDALSGVVYQDDAQVITLAASKQYAGVGESPRVVITVTP